MNKTLAFYIIGALCVIIFPFTHERGNPQLQEHIAEEIIRFHVIANSDTDADQALKLKIKDQVVLFLRDKLMETENIEEARDIINTNLDLVEDTAKQVMENEGYDYTVKASLAFCDFPVKQYGDMYFPAGKYEALRVELGRAEGKNWWCVMFPSLCYVDETYDVITEDNKEQFKEILTQEEYESLFQSKEPPIFYKSKIMEWLNKVIDYFPNKG